jgi:hypothetical protein
MIKERPEYSLRTEARLSGSGQIPNHRNGFKAVKIAGAFLLLLASIGFFAWITTDRFTPFVSLQARRTISKRFIRVCLDQALIGTTGSLQQMGELTIRLYPKDKSPCGSRVAAFELRGADVMIPISVSATIPEQPDK